MEQMEFNLLREPWIKVMTKDYGIAEVSLTDALVYAGEYRCIACEMPTQDYAILRLLLAIVHTVVSRMKGEPFGDSSDAIRSWRSIWDDGCFDAQGIQNYLKQWEDRFWLFHPEKPFYQVPAAKDGTVYSAAKLVGELSKSNNVNKLRLMMNRTPNNVSYAEAARWLVHVNAFDDSSTKVGTGTGAGWLGQLGNIYAEGLNLFETLMLNLVLLRDGRSLWEEENRPIWEQPPITQLNKREIPIPNNQAELLTLQSRRILLQREGEFVTGYSDAGGDYFTNVVAYNEQMTLWRAEKVKKNEAPKFLPCRHSPERQAWRDSERFLNDETQKVPGVVQWVRCLKRKKAIENRFVSFRTVGAKYDSKGCSITETISDHVDFTAALLEDMDGSWTRTIGKQIDVCEEASRYIWYLYDDLSKASGNNRKDDQKDVIRQEVKERFYDRIDLPFRRWLTGIAPKADDDEESRDAAQMKWQKTAYLITLKLGEEMLMDCGNRAIVGHEVNGKDSSEYFCASKAWRQFRNNLGRCFDIKKTKAKCYWSDTPDH